MDTDGAFLVQKLHQEIENECVWIQVSITTALSLCSDYKFTRKQFTLQESTLKHQIWQVDTKIFQ